MFALIFILACLVPVAKPDLCGKYSVLTEIDHFYISQPFSQQISIDFKNYIDIFSTLGNQMERFKLIANNYSSIELLNAKEPKSLIPFTPSKNIIKVTSAASELPIECEKVNAQVLNFEPNEKSEILKILQQENIDKAQIFSLPVQKSLYSPNFQILNSPARPEVQFKNISTGLFPFITKAGPIQYAESNNFTMGAVEIGLCSKPNNYWDRDAYKPNFVRTLKSIINSLGKLKTLKDSVLKLPNFFKSLSTPQAPVRALDYKLSHPPQISKIITFFQKFNNVENWENSIPTDFSYFSDFKNTFKEIVKHFRMKPSVNTNIFSNFIFKNQTLTLPQVDNEQMLNYLGLDPERFGLCGPVHFNPLLVVPTPSSSPSTDPSEIIANINTRIFDRTDLATTFIVKPIIFNNTITTVKYVTQALRHAQASIEEPTPFKCTTQEGEKICEGYQTPGTEDQHQFDLLICGRALAQTNESIDIEKCPTTTAPLNVLAYRAECVPGVSTVVLSSVDPVRVSTVCDTHHQATNIFNTFPAFIETECEIKINVNTTDKTLLPQLQHDFFQNQAIGRVVTMRPSNITAPPEPEFTLSPLALIFISTIGAALASLMSFISILAIFDPQKCLGITKTICCCYVRFFHCCARCCRKDQYSPPTQDEDIKSIKNRKAIIKSQYPSRHSLASAPPSEHEVSRFLPGVSPPLSRRSSTHQIKRIDSEGNDLDSRGRQQPYNPQATAPRTYNIH